MPRSDAKIFNAHADEPGGTNVTAFPVGAKVNANASAVTAQEASNSVDVPILGAAAPAYAQMVTALPFDWTLGLGPLQLSPPTLTAPQTTINSVAQLETYRTFKNAFSLAGDAEVYEIGAFSGSPSGSLLLDFRGVPHLLDIPIRIGRFLNVRIVGVRWLLVDQSTSWLESRGHSSPLGNEKFNLQNRGADNSIGVFGRGQFLHQVDDKLDQVQQNAYFGLPKGYDANFDNARLPNLGWNIHTRMGWLAVIRSQHANGLFIEGCEIDCFGQQGDVVILENNGVAPETNALNCYTFCQNSRLLRWDGQSYHKNYGDGVHGDSFQSQGGGRRFRWAFENNHWESGQEGQVNTGNAGSNPPLKHTMGRNLQYINLPDATSEMNLNDYANPGELSGGPVMSQTNALESEEGPYPSGKWSMENIWVQNKPNFTMNLQVGRIDANEHAEVTEGISPIDFAPSEHLGEDYVGPH